MKALPTLPEDAVEHLRNRREIHLGQALTPQYMAALLLEDAIA